MTAFPSHIAFLEGLLWVVLFHPHQSNPTHTTFSTASFPFTSSAVRYLNLRTSETATQTLSETSSADIYNDEEPTSQCPDLALSNPIFRRTVKSAVKIRILSCRRIRMAPPHLPQRSLIDSLGTIPIRRTGQAHRSCAHPLLKTLPNPRVSCLLHLQIQVLGQALPLVVLQRLSFLVQTPHKHTNPGNGQ